ncbi:MAG: PDZ domain-containing protein [Planctomycetota bacterium]|nr:MAG: PDZ domain-containing protein [Planctomycetota bacterium]
MSEHKSRRATRSLTLSVFVLVATTIFAAQLAKPDTEIEKTTRLVCEMIERYHISRRPIDDDVSRHLWERFFKALDPQKLYFTKQDLDEFRSLRDKLDDQLHEGDVSFCFAVYERFLQRTRQRLQLAEKLVDADHDFTQDEEMVIDRESLSWPADESEAAERWRKRVKYDLLNLKLEEVSLEEARRRLHKRYHTLRKAFEETEPDEKLETYLSTLAHCFDPHSSYMSKQSLEEFQIAMRLSLEGIGAALRSEDGYTVVAEIIKGGAADKDGRLQVGDKIIAVAPDGKEYVDVVEMKLNHVVRLIRGKSGTTVRLKVVREGAAEPIEIELVRQKIDLSDQQAVKGEIINSQERLPNGRSAKIGVINIPSFYRDFSGAQRGDENFKSTARDVAQVLKDFERRGGVDAIVVDLRFNGGGALTEAIEVSGLFIEEGPIVQVKDQKGRVTTHDDEDERILYRGPLVVVCNRLSASASEIFAGVIRDYNRGIIVGDSSTHGKGTVQNVMPVGDLFRFFGRLDRGALKLTINQFYRVNGDSTQNRGVPSDVVLPSLWDHMDLGEAELENALPFDRVAPVEHRDYGLVSAAVVSQLKKASAERVAKSEEFRRLMRRIERYEAKKNRKTVTLNEEKLRQERAEEERLSKEDEKDERQEKEAAERREIFPDTYYNDEVLQVTLDYVELLKAERTAKLN